MSQVAPAAAAPSGAPAEGQSTSVEPSFDSKAALAELRRERSERLNLQTSFDSYKKDAASDRELLQRLKGAFTPEEAPKGKDPVQHLQGEYEAFLEQAMELKARGQELPVTTKLALNFYESQLDSLKTIASLKKELADVKGGVDRANHPDAPANNMAYMQMDNFLQQSLNQLYGTDPKRNAQKSRMYDAASSEIAEHLKALQQKSPGEWHALRRDQGALQSKVNEVLRGLVPPKALELLEEQEFKAKPLTMGELWGAFREAQTLFRTAKTPADKQKALEHQRSIRMDIQELEKKSRARRR